MRLIILGAPGSGKGTQANRICDNFFIKHISSGDMLRQEIEEKSPLGNLADKYISKGELVPDSLIVDLVKYRINKEDCIQGFLLDGFPRTLSQAEELDSSEVNIDAVIELHVPNEIIIERLSGRRIHLASGRSYHIKFNPPLEENLDDITGEPLIQRVDDQKETIQTRLRVYEGIITKMREFYKNHPKNIKYIYIDGTEDQETVYNNILHELKSL